MTRLSSNGLKNLMKSAALVAVVAGLGCGLSGTASAGYTPPTPALSIEDIARYDALGDLTIAPDGKHMVGMVAVKGQKWPVISVWDTSDLNKTPVWIPSNTNRIVQVGFFTSDKLYFVTEQPITGRDSKPTFTRKIYYADLDGRNIQEPFRISGTMNKDVRDAMDRGISATVFNAHLYDENKVLMETTDPESFVQKIYELNTQTGQTRTVALGSEKGNYLSAGVDLETGEPLIKAEEDIIGGDYWYKVYIKDKTSGQWVYQAPLSYKFKERKGIEVLGFDSDPDKLIVASNVQSDHTRIYAYDIKAQTFSAEPLFANDKYDVNDVGFHIDHEKHQTSIMSVLVDGPTTTRIWLDDKWAGVQQSLQATFPGRNVSLGISRSALDSAIVTVEAPDMPPMYYLYKDSKLTPLGGQRPWVDPKTLGKPEFVTYKARDGLEIPAFITYPAGWTPDKGPVSLVVLPHGGPWARDYADWDSSGWPQFLATRGVAVIQPQYRGSKGWGSHLWMAGDKEWGQKMSDDNDDAAAYMVSRGIADPKRMAIFGYSYGGFAAIAASVRPNSPYRCAIAGAGVSSLQRIGSLWGADHLQRDVQGVTVDGMDPIKNVANANIPIMLYHGDHDRQADTEHSRMFYAAMKAAGKDVEYHEIKGMWHTLPWHPEWYTETLGYIEAYLKSPKCGLIG